MISARNKVRKFAESKELELNEWGDDGYWIVQGSTIVYITFSIVNDTTQTEMVSFTSIVVRNLRIDNILMSKLLKLNAQMNFGAFGLDDDMVSYRYNILGNDHIDEDEFFNALAMVALVADEYDNKIIATHGGVTGLDYIRDQINAENGITSNW